MASEAEPRRFTDDHPAVMRAAAFRACRLYPDAVGEMLAQEIIDAIAVPYLLGPNAVIRRVVRHTLDKPEPAPPEPPTDTAPEPVKPHHRSAPATMHAPAGQP